MTKKYEYIYIYYTIKFAYNIYNNIYLDCFC